MLAEKSSLANWLGCFAFLCQYLPHVLSFPTDFCTKSRSGDFTVICHKYLTVILTVSSPFRLIFYLSAFFILLLLQLVYDAASVSHQEVRHNSLPEWGLPPNPPQRRHRSEPCDVHKVRWPFWLIVFNSPYLFQQLQIWMCENYGRVLILLFRRKQGALCFIKISKIWSRNCYLEDILLMHYWLAIFIGVYWSFYPTGSCLSKSGKQTTQIFSKLVDFANNYEIRWWHKPLFLQYQGRRGFLRILSLYLKAVETWGIVCLSIEMETYEETGPRVGHDIFSAGHICIYI